ncbi:hypothetical protein LZ32DRAFT_267292 [Colletotrichum eremochloae]|nr:hypothetical protein LZ32DRAFT_267292 [Colletotrichum eremochloae]
MPLTCLLFCGTILFAPLSEPCLGKKTVPHDMAMSSAGGREVESTPLAAFDIWQQPDVRALLHQNIHSPLHKVRLMYIQYDRGREPPGLSGEGGAALCTSDFWLSTLPTAVVPTRREDISKLPFHAPVLMLAIHSFGLEQFVPCHGHFSVMALAQVRTHARTRQK